jgi:hypothetical protein
MEFSLVYNRMTESAVTIITIFVYYANTSCLAHPCFNPMSETRFYVDIMAEISLSNLAVPYIDVGISHRVTRLAILQRFTFLATRH